MNSRKWGSRVDGEVLAEIGAARRYPPQHLFASLKPKCAEHGQQPAQHRELTQQQPIAALEQLSHENVVGLMHRFPLAIAACTQMGQQHLPRRAALVEQLPEGLIGRIAKALQQGLAQIQPGAIGQL